MTVSPLDALLTAFDRHIESRTATARRPTASPIAGPSSLNIRRDELRNLIAPASTSTSSASSSAETLQLSPLERAIYYEVENRRHALERKSRELDFWEAYENELADNPMKMPTSTAALERQIAEKQQRLRKVEAENKLRVETARALESSAVIQKVLSTTSPKTGGMKGKDAGEDEGERTHYASTRDLLEQRDDQALEFLKIFNDIRAVKQERLALKARIREQRLQTMKLLESIKNIKADIRNRQLHTSSLTPQDSDASQDMAVVHKVQQIQREITEARSKKELVKGILRGLILESGRDWTKEPSTRALMLSLDDDEDAASEDAFSDEEEEGEQPGERDEEEEDDEDIDQNDDEGIEHLEDE